MTSITDYSYSFDRIIVIESIPSGEERTGEQLYQLVVRPRAAAAEAVTAYHFVVSAEELMRCLWAIERKARLEQGAPTIHLEMHGTSEGLRLANDEIVKWSDLIAPFTAINTASRLNLAVTVAACYGAAFSKCISPVRPAPVCLIIGTADVVWSNVVKDGFRAYYSTLLDTLDTGEAWLRLNKVADADGQRFIPSPVKYLFRVAFAEYINQHGTPEAAEERARRMTEELVSSGRILIRAAEDTRRWLRAQFADHEAAFNTYKRRFFMHDRFPECASRFGMSFSDVLSTARQN